jgi:dephospho-CoA kinase
MLALRTDFAEPKPIVFGLTGNIACGKSFVASLLQKALIPVIDADDCTRNVQAPGSEGLGLLTEAFGKEILSEDGSLNRRKLGDMVFGDKEQLTKLNAIMHPLIINETQWQIQLRINAECRFICYDAALLIESGLTEAFRPLVVVSCKPEKQLERLLKRGLTEDQARKRMASQMPTKNKEEMADIVIDTNGSKEETTYQTEALISSITTED